MGWDLEKIDCNLPENVLNQIFAAPLQVWKNESNSFIWKNSPHGNFTVKNATALSHAHLSVVEKNDWKSIWKCNTLPRIQRFSLATIA